MNDSLQLVIRRARVDDAPALGALAFRAKAHWGYDAAFMEACRGDLKVTADDVATRSVYVHEEDGRLNGFYQLRLRGEEAEMVALFIEPRAMGRGVGKQLWRHAVATASDRGCRELVLQSDPRAEGFYRAMGAERVGESALTVFPGRMLPHMRFALGWGHEVASDTHTPKPSPG